MPSFSTALLLFLISLSGDSTFAQVPKPLVNSSAVLGFSEEQLDRYVAAVGAIERKREEILRRAKNSNSWTNAVQQAEAHNKDICRVPTAQQAANIQSLCRELQEFSKAEIRKHGLTNREFNQITIALRLDRQLQSRIQTRLQRFRRP